MSGYVGIDLHRRRSVVVHHDDAGNKTRVARIDNDYIALASEVALAGKKPKVVIEATYGWYWAVDALEELGCEVHLAHPLGLKGFVNRRVKNDEADAGDLADLLRLGRLPEAWIAPPQTRELRELVRYRCKLVQLRSGLKSQVHQVLAKCGVAVPMRDVFGVGGTRLLDELCLPDAYAHRVRSLRGLIGAYLAEINDLDKKIAVELTPDPRWKVLQQIPGVGPTLAAVFIAEVGDAARFPGPAQLCSWAGMTPRHRESDTKVRRGRITKQGSPLLRWACVEAAQKLRAGSKLKADYTAIGQRRGAKIARVAIGRKILTLVYYGLRDGEIRCLVDDAA